MAIALLGLIEAIRTRLDDFGGDRGPPSAGYYARWQEDDRPCLWKNPEIVDYINRALLEIAGRAPWTEEGIAGSQASARVRVIALKAQCVLNAAIFEIEKVRLASTGTELVKTDTGRLAAEHGDGWNFVSGTPERYFEPRRGVLHLWPIPVRADTLILSIRRRPLEDLSWARVSKESIPSSSLDDVPDDLLEALVTSACHYAYLKHDADTFDPQAAQDCERRLGVLVGPPVTWAQKEARRENANLSVAMRGYPYARRR